MAFGTPKRHDHERFGTQPRPLVAWTARPTGSGLSASGARLPPAQPQGGRVRRRTAGPRRPGV